MLDSFKCFYAFILHDKDINENGELKKPHFHIVLDYSDGKEKICSRIEKVLKVNNNSVRVKYIQNPIKMVRYLTHRDSKDKYKYDDSEVITNDNNKYCDLLVLKNDLKETTDELLQRFCNDIMAFKVCCYDEAFRWFKENNRLSYFVSHAKVLTQFIDDILRFTTKESSTYAGGIDGGVED